MASCAEKMIHEDYMSELEERIARGERSLDPLAQLLHMEILFANPQEAEGVMHVGADVLNPYGMVHGGCLVALADSVAGHNMAAAGKLCVTLSSQVNFLSAAKGKCIRCRSTMQKVGKRISVVAVEQEDEEGKLVLTGSFTFSMVKEIPPHSITAPTEEDA